MRVLQSRYSDDIIHNCIGLATFLSFFLCGAVTLIPSYFALANGRYYDPLPYSLFKSTLVCLSSLSLSLLCLSLSVSLPVPCLLSPHG
jgi:VIT1/CCC1 family predicted Fe2+/Mn2+ transporter